MRPRGVLAAWTVLCVAAIASGGCVSAVLAPRIVTAPNQTPGFVGWTDARPEVRVALARLYAHTFRVAVDGPPAAEIAVAVLEPGDYHQRHVLDVRPGVDGKPGYVLDTHWDPRPEGAPRATAKGTIVVLHGFWMSREVVLHWAVNLAQSGYRTVLADLRGHGASTGQWVTYGARETGDLSRVLEALRERDLAGPRIGVLGVSYGGSIGLLWASRDPRIATVVALAPYADPQLAIRQYARAFLPPALSRTLSDRSIAAATRKAARLAEFRWAELDVVAAVAGMERRVLLIHGAADTLIPPEHSHQLYAAATPGSRLLELPGEDHFSLALRLDGMSEAVVRWFDEHLHAPDAP